MGANKPIEDIEATLLAAPAPLSDAALSTQWAPNPVSRASLPKMGMLAIVTGDFCEMACEFAKLGVQRPAPNCKSPPTAGFSAL
jgi:hypothetical protein